MLCQSPLRTAWSTACRHVLQSQQNGSQESSCWLSKESWEIRTKNVSNSRCTIGLCFPDHSKSLFFHTRAKWIITAQLYEYSHLINLYNQEKVPIPQAMAWSSLLCLKGSSGLQFWWWNLNFYTHTCACGHMKYLINTHFIQMAIYEKYPLWQTTVRQALIKPQNSLFDLLKFLIQFCC